MVCPVCTRGKCGQLLPIGGAAFSLSSKLGDLRAAKLLLLEKVENQT